MPTPLAPQDRLGYGIQLPVQAKSPAFAAPWERDAGLDELLGIARRADASGFSYVGVCDHVAIPRLAAEAMGTTWMDAIALLGLLSGLTEHTHLLTHVYVPAYRHPMQVAKAFATLDVISRGRVVMGFGAGHLRPEFEMLGVDYERRGALLEESIRAVDAALREDFPSLDGPTWRFGDMGVAPRPVQRPRPPIWVAGSSKAAMRRAAAHGDGWLPQMTSREELPGQIAYLMEHRRAVRGDDPIVINTFSGRLHVGTDHSAVKGNTICGTGEVVASSLLELASLGADIVQVSFFARSATELEDQIEAFGTEVAPHLSR